MNPITPILLVSALLAASSASAQEATAKATAPTTGTEVSLAYFGELFAHPGVVAGVKFRPVDRRWYDLTVGPSLGFYVHPRNHSSLFLDAEVENRFTASFGLFGTLGASVGYQHAWLGSRVFVRDDDGGVKQRFDWGRPYLKSGLSLGFGWDFEKNRLAPLRVFLRLDAFGRAPFNHGILPHAAAQAGIVYRFGGN